MNRIIICFGIALLIFSCKEEIVSELNVSNKAPIENGIVIFNSEQDLNEAIKLSTNSSPMERKTWEKSHGITSFGTYCNELYQNLKTNDFKSFDDIKSFVEANSEYYQLIDDGGGEYTLETKHFISPYRYIMNMDQMVQVGNKVYKVFEKGMASAPIENIEMLKNIDELTIAQFTTNSSVEFIPYQSDKNKLKSAEGWCGNSFKEWNDNGNNRTVLYISLTQSAMGWGSSAVIQGTILPYKRTLGVWFSCARSMSWYCKYVIWGPVHSDDILTGDNYGTRSDFYNTKTITTDKWGEFHFLSIDAWADTPSTNYARVNCQSTF